MKILEVTGGNELSGLIKISGAKNSAVALIPAAILADEDVTICNVPDITDIDVLEETLKFLGADVRRASESMVITPSTIENKSIPSKYAKKLRASYYFMGALLGKYKHVEISIPGGCSIGQRPINIHLKGFEALGAKITNDGENYIIHADELKGTNIYLDFPSVGATINIMLAAVMATGTTTIDNAAKEPEIANIATFLNNMGANIRGAGTNTIKIKGVEKLNGCFHEVIPDRIEAGTFTILGALTGKELKIYNIIPEHIEALTSKLKEAGVPIRIAQDYLVISKTDKYKPVNIKTLVFPGFATDLQQAFMILSTQMDGKTTIEETIFENRFMQVPFLNKMGADIKVIGSKAYINGPTIFEGTEVEATDLRAGASLLIAALQSKGKTTIKNVEHILRGYEDIVEKLTNVGAKIEIKEV